jgi:serine/arginine repetitive matrix protein 2
MNLTRDKEKETRRERKMSLASDLPFITIERKPPERADDVTDGQLRRSISLPGMEAPGRLDLEKPLPSISSDNFMTNADIQDVLLSV